LDLRTDRFRLLSVIGEGGTARVYRAKDTRTGDTVAVKVLRKGLLHIKECVSRFKMEAELLARFEHPNILPMIARGKSADGAPWFATTYASRGSLADRMVREGLIPRQELLEHVEEVLDALNYLHKQGIVHRDIKPENILFDEHDIAMLCDFGIALAPERRATILGDRMGTPSFMPPEQYTDPSSVTATADLFGVGVTLFVGLTGQTGMVLLVDHLREEALAGLPSSLRDIVDRATRTRPEERYSSAWLMALDLADVLEER
jgi:serine/threonine protein kinase